MLYPKFRTKAGLLTPYALTCGYIQRASDTGEYVSSRRCVDLWHEGACYHVRYWDDGRKFWVGFPTLGEARKCWSGVVRRQRLIRHP